EFARFDTRRYPTVSVNEGYGLWAGHYEATVHDEMDIALLERLSVRWADARQAVDLACGTGRTGVWLRAHGVAAIDGVDLTAEMLELARLKNAYRSLRQGNILATGLPVAAYDLVAQSLADEHLAELPPLYAEAARLLRAGGVFVLVGY